MRKIAFLLCIIISLPTIDMFAQTTENFNYQAVIRDADGELITDQSISVQLSIIESTIDGTVIYTETHSVTSGSTGIINLLIGNGTVSLGDFSTINWGVNSKFIKIEINQGSGYIDMGTFQLFSVPYALYAKDVENKDDADADPVNEIQDISLAGTDLSITSGSTVDLSVIQDGVDDADNNPNNELQTLTIDGDTLEISGGNQVVFPYDSSSWAINGEKIYYNTGNVGIGSSDPVSNLEVKATAAGSEALFQVINANNDTVFAVYPDGVKIFVDPTAKGKVGGFAVSGRTSTKAGKVDILKVTVDSTRIYVSDTVGTKGKVGGFAVSGRTSTKGVNNDYLVVTGDSTRIYVNDTSTTKGKVGGFAVSGRTSTKGVNQNIFIATIDSTRIFTRDTISGFGVRDNSSGKSTSYLQLSPNNYFIGHDVATNLTTGVGNSIFGYKAGNGLKKGNDNIFIGNEAGYNTGSGSGGANDNIFIGNGAGYNTGAGTVGGNENIFIGNGAGFNTGSPVRNVFIGHEAGYENVSGQYNLYVGNNAGKNATGGANTILGGLAGAYNDFGSGNVAIGYVAGRDMVSSDNIFIGRGAGYNNSSTGGENIFIGVYAGEDIPDQNLRLEISNSRTKPPLIYGEFDNQRLAINGRTTNDYTFYVNGDAGGSSVWNSLSDVRLKKNIVTIGSALQKIMLLKGIYYSWINNENEHGRQIGFIAQDVEKVLPELVNTKGEYYSMQYAPVTAVLVEAVKEQQSQIEKLRSENEVLKQKLNEIIEKLDLE